MASLMPVCACVQVACILLPLCFLYDVFWVFLQPLLTHSDSVMVDVRPSLPLSLQPVAFQPSNFCL